MTLEKHQELIKLIENMADRAGTCDNKIDRELFAKVLGYLIDLQTRQSKELE